MELAGKKIVLGLTGGIACYKSAEFVRAMIRAGAEVQVVMTQGALKFITTVTMQALSGKPVFYDQWDSRVPNNMAHINLPRDADAIVVAPASADFMARIANGLCNDLLSGVCIARPQNVPLYLAPAMNVEMWKNPATQRNVAQLKTDGVGFFGPAVGEQACGDVGEGRMLEANELLDMLIASFQPKLLAGKKVLMTAGPTLEPIDPVRVITNRSSGKMGYSIARAAQEAGAEVVLVSGPTALPAPMGVTRINVRTAQEMYDTVLPQAENFDVFIAVAAVADWRVLNTSEQKMKKTSKNDVPEIKLTQNPDILASVAKLKNRPYCVGFAAESEQLLKHGEAKRKSKNIPLLVGNIGHETFGLDENELILFDEKGNTNLPRNSKQNLARQLIAQIAERLG